MAELPTGTVTFLFTDIEGSTRLLDALADRYGDALEAHDLILREAFAAHGGRVVDTQGDAFFVAFQGARNAVEASAHAQRALGSHAWPEGVPLRVRMGIHTGEPTVRGDRYVGQDVHRGARIAAAGHGGQVLLSQTTRDLLGDEPGDELSVRDLGHHRLKDLTAPQRLYQLVIAGLESEFPAPRTLENRPTNLPTQPTPLIGRERELERADALLRRAGVQLLTFTGPGGTGKTRLAVQLAAELLEEFRDGVFLVDLAPITDPELIVPTIAQTLAVRELPGRPVAETLAEHLRDRRFLLLLDNFEQVLEGAPSLAALLGTAPDLKLLVTSRAPLHLAAEHEYAVPPLGLPDVEHLPEPAALSQYEAVALFVERARAARPDFEVTGENAPAVAEICVRLDGLPLAIELAAARVRALPPQALLRRLEQRLELLTGGALDAPARQRTLRAAIDWSYALLDEDEQRLFGRLSVFAGGCDLEAAEAVCEADGLEILDGIASLVEKSLVRGHDDARAEPRYSMLESIHEYAREKLESGGELQTLRWRHAEYFLALSERAARALTGEEFSDEEAPEERVQGELPNLRAALQWAFDEGDPELILRLAASASWAWAVSANLTEARALILQALDASLQSQTADRARALWLLAFVEGEQGTYRDAGDLYQQALELFRRHDDRPWIVRTLGSMAQHAAIAGDESRARSLLEEAGSLADELGSDYARGQVLFAGATVENCAGDDERAEVLLDEGAALFRELGVPRRLWLAHLINVGWLALQRHDFARAKAALEEYLAEESWKNPGGIANAEGNLGLVALYEGARDEASSRFRRAVALARDSGQKRTLVEGLYGLAAVAAMDGDAERSARLRAAADAIFEAMALPHSAPEQFIIERYLEPAGAGLADDVQARARAEGGSLTVEQAVAYALGP